MSTTTLQRTHFTIGRAAEYFDADELAAQTGRPEHEFAAVVLKELVDNALDAAEAANVKPLITIRIDRQGDDLIISVADNGPGLAADTLEKILDFDTRTSDKSRYRSPTRGAQGNALKTVIGIPTALGGGAPIVLESNGLRHTINPRIDNAGFVDVGHCVQEQPSTVGGTRITVTLPADGQAIDITRWVRTFALCNPHMSVKIECSQSAIDGGYCDGLNDADFYQSSAACVKGWRKWLPTDPTSPHWYDASALSALIDAEVTISRQNGIESKLLRDFVREFRGLSASAKAKQVCASLPHVRRLADLNGDVGTLLAALHNATTPAKPSVLGWAGQEHVRACIDQWHGIVRDRFWYQCVTTLDGGIPLVVEVAVAETQESGGLLPAVNFSPTFDDPLSGSLLGTDKVSGHGLAGYLSACHINWRWAIPGAPKFTVFVHIVHPALTFLDRGKSRIDPSETLRNAASIALWKAAKTAWADGERRRKDAAAASRRRQAQEKAWDRTTRTCSLKEAAFAVMEEAWRKATNDGAGPASGRAIFYQARPLIQGLTDDEISDTYFTQSLLPAYQREVRALPGVYYEPRGWLHEPHSGNSVPLGTREVDGYSIPDWTYDKILFVEKEGELPRLQAGQLAERYDMAIVTSNGFATVAARTLLAQAATVCRIFVLHDADPNGYNIALTLREETRRMPDHRIEVVDIGLMIGEAESLGLEAEKFTRRKALPKRLRPVLGDAEQRAWKLDTTATKHHPAICQRVELNAMTYPQIIAHIEQALERHGATQKVVPDAETIEREADARVRAAVNARVSEMLDNLIDRDALTARITAEILGGREPLTTQTIRSQIEPRMPEDWRSAVASWAEGAVAVADQSITQKVRAAIKEGTS